MKLKPNYYEFVYTVLFILACLSIMTYLSDLSFDNILLMNVVILFCFILIIFNQKRAIEIFYSKEGIRIVTSRWFKKEEIFVDADSLRITKERRVKAKGVKVWLYVVYNRDLEVLKIDWKSGFSENNLDDLMNLIPK